MVCQRIFNSKPHFSGTDELEIGAKGRDLSDDEVKVGGLEPFCTEEFDKELGRSQCEPDQVQKRKVRWQLHPVKYTYASREGRAHITPTTQKRLQEVIQMRIEFLAFLVQPPMWILETAIQTPMRR